ncbi:MAG: hypothetical protein ABIS92_12470 [Polyangia bacterium]
MLGQRASFSSLGRFLVLVVVAADGCAGMQAARKPDPVLQPYLACQSSDPDVRVVHTDRWPGRETFREVNFGTESRRVSVVDGYRLLYAQGGTETPFANVKVERSAPTEYAADKAFLVRMQQSMPKFDSVTYWSAAVNGMEVHGIDKTAIDVGGVVGVYMIFEDRKQVVTSIYMLNQNPKVRKFVDLASYKVVRDRFLDGLTRCASSH